MSRAFIEVVAAAIILGLTAAAYYVTTSTLEARIQNDVRERVEQARDQVVEKTTLDSLGRLNRVEALAAVPVFGQALGAEGAAERARIADQGFRGFLDGLAAGEPRPDIVALADAAGDVVAMLDVGNPLPGMWKNGDELEYPAIALALSSGQIVSEVWDYERDGLMKAGVAPVMGEGDAVLGAVVIAYAVSALEIQRQQRDLFGAEVAYFHGEQIYATSFRPGPGTNEQSIQEQLARALAREQLGQMALAQGTAPRPVSVTLGDHAYLATAARLPQLSSRPRPEGYAASMAGLMVMMSLSDALAPLVTLKLAILLLGIAAAILTVLAIEMVSRRLLAQADEIQASLNEALSGNLDWPPRVDRGAELGGLASSLDVLLVRLRAADAGAGARTGGGAQIIASPGAPVDFDDGGPSVSVVSAADPATLALVQEAEEAYYGRLFQEYLAARRQVGAPVEGVEFEEFTAKLRLSESNLRQKYRCTVVRFRVVVKDGKVTLKPVPIV